MQEERDKLWDDIQRMERRCEDLKRQYEATGNNRIRQKKEAFEYALGNMYFQLSQMAKSDSDRMHYTRH